MITLRDYQSDLYIKTREAFRNGSEGVCCVLPCRSGKSFVMAKMIENAKGKVLVLAHRHSLIAQHKELLQSVGILTDKVRVASVFTEAKRLEQYSPDDVDLIIIDEAHLSEALSYRKVCEYYSHAKRVLFTATPARLDGKPLTLADTLITGITAKELIKQGAISEYDYYAPDLNIDLDSVDTVAGEYNNGQLTELMCKSAIYGDVLKYYRQLGEERQAIAYCTSVKHSKETADMFNANGITAVSIDGSMAQKERDAKMKQFTEGKVQVLCNCNLISEGITLPNASVGLLLRPTMSLPLYIQQACRVLTPVPNKKAVIIDFCNNVRKFGLPTQEHEWTLGEPIKKRREFTEEGTFTIRQCPKCFKVFEASDTCPYCGEPYPLHPREVAKIEAIELKRFEEEEAEKLEAQRKQERIEVGRAKTKDDLMKIAKARGYKIGWVFKQMQLKGIRK